MSDKYRVIGKVDEKSSEAVYLLEIQLNRTIMVTRDDMQSIFSALGEGNSDGGWNEVIDFLSSCLNDDITSEDTKLLVTEFKDISFSNENLKGLLYALKTQDEQFSIYTEGTPDTGSVAIIINMGSRVYKKTITSSAQARSFAQNMSEFKEQAVLAAAINPKTIEKLTQVIDWVLRVAGIYDIAEAAYRTAREKIEQERQRIAFNDSWRDHFEREKAGGIQRAREWEIKDRINKTA
jgi:hypothetical protein